MQTIKTVIDARDIQALETIRRLFGIHDTVSGGSERAVWCKVDDAPAAITRAEPHNLFFKAC